MFLLTLSKKQTYLLTEGLVNTSKASIKVPGYPYKIFDFDNGSGSYIHLTKEANV